MFVIAQAIAENQFGYFYHQHHHRGAASVVILATSPGLLAKNHEVGRGFFLELNFECLINSSGIRFRLLLLSCLLLVPWQVRASFVDYIWPSSENGTCLVRLVAGSSWWNRCIPVLS